MKITIEIPDNTITPLRVSDFLRQLADDVRQLSGMFKREIPLFDGAKNRIGTIKIEDV